MQGVVAFIKADDLDLIQLVGLLQRLNDARRIVRKQPHHAAQVGVGGQHVGGLLLGGRLRALVRVRAENLEPVAFQHFFHGAVDQFAE